MKETRHSHHVLELRTASDGGRTLSGIIKYGVESSPLPFTEIVQRGAFASALEPGADVLALVGHDERAVIGRTLAGTLTLADSPEGLTFRISLPNTTQANDLAENIRQKNIDGVSFGFTTDKDGQKWEKRDGKLFRTLTRVSLLEVSPTAWPAYVQNSVSVRSIIPAEFQDPVTEPDDELELLRLRVNIAERNR